MNKNIIKVLLIILSIVSFVKPAKALEDNTNYFDNYIFVYRCFAYGYSKEAHIYYIADEKICYGEEEMKSCLATIRNRSPYYGGGCEYIYLQKKINTF